MSHPVRMTPGAARAARAPHAAALLIAAAALAPAAQAAEPVDFSLDDGLTWRGDGWKANLGATIALDGGEQVTGTGRSDDLVVRRLRPNLVVSLSPQWSARVEYDFGDVGPGFRNAWVQWRPNSKLSVRLGSQFAPFGLENTMSSRTMPFTERSASSAMTPAALTGLSARLHDQRWSLSAGVYGNDIADDDRRRFDGESFIARGTFVPLRQDGWLWHVGASGEYRQGANDATLRLRSRPETVVTTTRLVDTGVLTGVEELVTVGVETAVRRGPVLVQAEYLQASASRTALAGGDADFSGGYVAASWFVTGERRNYSEAQGAFGGVKPKRDWGALEVALRASTFDLDDGLITGGKQDSLTATVNWYYESHSRVSLTWVETEATRAGLTDDRGYVMLRAQIAF
jgi:phosphate-selective porin OprO and OprP